MKVALTINLFGGVTLHVPAIIDLDSIPKWRRPTIEQSARAAGEQLAAALSTPEDGAAEYLGYTETQ